VSALAIRDLNVHFAGGAHVLRDISLTIAAGERVAVLGESGCGKTTLVRAVLGLLADGASVSGEIVIAGTPVPHDRPDQMRAWRGRRIGYVPQNPLSSFDPLSAVGRQVRQAWKAHGEAISATELQEHFAAVGLAETTLLDRRPAAWSGGMLQRALIIAATALRPELVLADEPTSAIDRPLARQMLELIARRSRTVIAVTHDIDLAHALTDRIVVLYGGRIVEDGPSAQVFHSPRHPYTRALLSALPQPGRLPDDLDGDPPSPQRTGGGCDFAPRCLLRTSACQTAPAFVAGVACHHPTRPT